jgi:hypothetical protein
LVKVVTKDAKKLHGMNESEQNATNMQQNLQVSLAKFSKMSSSLKQRECEILRNFNKIAQSSMKLNYNFLKFCKIL